MSIFVQLFPNIMAVNSALRDHLQSAAPIDPILETACTQGPEDALGHVLKTPHDFLASLTTWHQITQGTTLHFSPGYATDDPIEIFDHFIFTDTISQGFSHGLEQEAAARLYARRLYEVSALLFFGALNDASDLKKHIAYGAFFYTQKGSKLSDFFRRRSKVVFDDQKDAWVKQERCRLLGDYKRLYTFLQEQCERPQVKEILTRYEQQVRALYDLKKSGSLESVPTKTKFWLENVDCPADARLYEAIGWDQKAIETFEGLSMFFLPDLVFFDVPDALTLLGLSWENAHKSYVTYRAMHPVLYFLKRGEYLKKTYPKEWAATPNT